MTIYGIFFFNFLFCLFLNEYNSGTNLSNHKRTFFDAFTKINRQRSGLGGCKDPQTDVCKELQNNFKEQKFWVRNYKILSKKFFRIFFWKTDKKRNHNLGNENGNIIFS